MTQPHPHSRFSPQTRACARADEPSGIGPSGEVTLSAASVDAVAQRVAELIQSGEPARVDAWVSAREIADVLGVDRDYVYRHAVELGGRKLSKSPKASWRFSLEVATTGYASRGSAVEDSVVVEPKQRRRRPAGLGTTVDLLPIRGSEAA